MAEENQNYTETEIMFGALDRVIREEMKKKPSKRDNKLIDECIVEMAKLKNVRTGYTEEEIGAIVEQLEAKAAKKTERVPVRRKSVRRMAAVVCAACLIVGCGVATVAWNPFEGIKDWMICITNTPLGTVEEIDKITYVNYDVTIQYDSIQELLSNETLEVYYPTILPDNISITKVELLRSAEKTYIIFYFNNTDIKYTIQCDTSYSLNNPEYETIRTNKTTFYISHQNDKYFARGNIDSDLYLIECSDYQELILIINNLTKGS